MTDSPIEDDLLVLPIPETPAPFFYSTALVPLESAMAVANQGADPSQLVTCFFKNRFN